MNSGLSLPEAIVFDVDGTFYHQRPVRRRMTLRLARFCLSSPVEGWRTVRLLSAYRKAQETLRFQDTDGAPARQLECACARLRVDPGAAESVVKEWMGDKALDVVVSSQREGLLDFIKAARERGVRLGIFSDYPAEAKLRALDLLKMFDCVLSAQDAQVGTFKPSARGLLECLRRLNALPERSLYVGDRPEIDGEAARRAGMKGIIIGLPEGSFGPGWTGVTGFRSLQANLGL
jgi:FMN phosphatase YigB (HAD superfamily)